MTPLDTRPILARVSTLANHPAVPYRLLRNVIALVEALQAERRAHDQLAEENCRLRRTCSGCTLKEAA